MSPVIVIEENGNHYFGDGWGRVNIAYAFDEPLTVATYRRKSSDDDHRLLAQLLAPAAEQERVQNPQVEIYWWEEDNPSEGGWVWHFVGVDELVHPIEGKLGKNPSADDEDLKFEATMDPDFPGGDVRFVVDRDNTPIFG